MAQVRIADNIQLIHTGTVIGTRTTGDPIGEAVTGATVTCSEGVAGLQCEYA